MSHSKEPERELARRVAEGGCILRSVVGSTVHGLSNPGTDDRDEMGVCVEPPEYVIGLRRFDHRRTGRAFLGYLDGQRRSLLGERHAPRTRELSRDHGYDTKYAMHALRIAHQGNELITTGRISLPVAEPARSQLMEVRRGKVPLADVLAELDDRTASLERSVHDSRLSEEADRAAIDDFLVSAYQRTWGPEDTALRSDPAELTD